jgi:hypothetical protein
MQDSAGALDIGAAGDNDSTSAAMKPGHKLLGLCARCQDEIHDDIGTERKVWEISPVAENVLHRQIRVRFSPVGHANRVTGLHE